MSCTKSMVFFANTPITVLIAAKVSFCRSFMINKSSCNTCMQAVNQSQLSSFFSSSGTIARGISLSFTLIPKTTNMEPWNFPYRCVPICCLQDESDKISWWTDPRPKDTLEDLYLKMGPLLFATERLSQDFTTYGVHVHQQHTVWLLSISR